MFCRYLTAFSLVNLSRSARETLCLYHSCSQQEHIYRGPVDTDLWNFLTNCETESWLFETGNLGL